MYKLNKLKAFVLFFILGIAVLGCQNATKTSAKNEASKVYVSLAVDGMTCSGCEKTVQGALIAIDGIDSAFASHVEKQVKVFVDTTNVSLIEIQDAINAKGYTAGELVK
ncbi:MAG: cation transporter [Bacteroidales bacterium]|jgi:copper chaperone CopZ|nr:cation transporter [Bacteroidales bacterium]